jgi:hypothetical protein
MSTRPPQAADPLANADAQSLPRTAPSSQHTPTPPPAFRRGRDRRLLSSLALSPLPGQGRPAFRSTNHKNIRRALARSLPGPSPPHLPIPFAPDPLALPCPRLPRTPGHYCLTSSLDTPAISLTPIDAPIFPTPPCRCHHPHAPKAPDPPP